MWGPEGGGGCLALEEEAGKRRQDARHAECGDEGKEVRAGEGLGVPEQDPNCSPGEDPPIQDGQDCHPHIVE